MIIRKAIKSDIKRIQELLKEVGNVHSELRPDLFIKDKTKYDAAELEQIIQNNLKPVFVYINNENELCGYAFCLIQEIEGNNLVSHKTIYIDDICVDSKHRHEHIGSALYDYVLEYARSIECYNITLNVWNGNEPAIKFYEKCGLKVQKTVMETILDNNPSLPKPGSANF